MAAFNEIKRLAKPAAAWFYAVANDLRAEVHADPDRFQREYDERSADWDQALKMYDTSAARLGPAAHDAFAAYVTTVTEQRPRVAALLTEARAAASENAARILRRDISGPVDGFGIVRSDADSGL